MTDPTPVETLDVAVPPLLDGVRVDRAVSMLTGLTRSEAAALIAARAVKVGGVVVARGSVVLREGQRLLAELPGEEDGAVAADADVAFPVVVEDPEFVVVDKPAGLVVHPGAGHREGTLIAGLLARYPEIESVGHEEGSSAARPGVVQRLDKGTSGLLVVARTPRAYRSLTAQLAERSVERVYLALAEGIVEDDHGVIDAPIGRSQRTPTKMAVRASGRPARTAYRVLGRHVDPPRTYLELRLESGRTHQIRVHLSAIGRPLVNDPRYGARREPALEEGRVFLHAAVLGFAHPATGATVRVESVLPVDLARVLDAPS